MQGGGSIFRLAEDWALYVYSDSRISDVVETLRDQVVEEERALAKAKALLAKLQRVQGGRR